jgi:phosphatidylserine/phosphatidylglycerophosphate/cardiolipin synthase-like enzyme
MRVLFPFAALLLLAPLGSSLAQQTFGDTTVCFTPGQPCAGLIAETIRGARSEILVQAFGFTNATVIDALNEAQQRGIAVTVLLDKSVRKEPSQRALELVKHGVKAFIDDRVAIAHNKVMVIDGVTVITGSFNFTQSAQSRNAENLLVIRNPQLASAYRENFKSRMAEATQWKP